MCSFLQSFALSRWLCGQPGRLCVPRVQACAGSRCGLGRVWAPPAAEGTAVPPSPSCALGPLVCCPAQPTGSDPFSGPPEMQLLSRRRAEVMPQL